ncbi:amp-ligase [Moniliophthora roreri]|nr:amp-ligase [Moniliophthora roreri]
MSAKCRGHSANCTGLHRLAHLSTTAFTKKGHNPSFGLGFQYMAAYLFQLSETHNANPSIISGCYHCIRI